MQFYAVNFGAFLVQKLQKTVFFVLFYTFFEEQIFAKTTFSLKILQIVNRKPVRKWEKL